MLSAWNGDELSVSCYCINEIVGPRASIFMFVFLAGISWFRHKL